MATHAGTPNEYPNIYFCGEVRKIFISISLLSRAKKVVGFLPNSIGNKDDFDC